MGPAWTTQEHHYQNYYSNNKLVTSSPEKFGTMGVTTGKKMTMISALLGEKLAHLRADLQLGLYRLAHPVHPQIRRIAAQESNIAQKSVATEKRRQLEAKARALANQKRMCMRDAQRARASSLITV